MINSLLLDAQNGTEIEFDYLSELIPESAMEYFTPLTQELDIFQMGQCSGVILEGSERTANQRIPSFEPLSNHRFYEMTDQDMVDENIDFPLIVAQNQDIFPEKSIKKNNSQQNFSSDSGQDYSSSLHKKRKTKAKNPTKREQYPTKNFLPSFRSSFINYLSPHFDRKEFDNMQIIYRIRNKKCINLKDYEQLFNTERFRPFLETYFDDQVIYRDLMSSRIESKTKAHYAGKLWVFEHAFRTRVFEKINY